MPEKMAEVLQGRVLPADEWDRLKDFGPFLQARVIPDKQHAIVTTLEADRRIVGSWMARDIVMLEALCLHEDYRHRTAPARRLFFTMMQALKDREVTQVITVTQDPEVEKLAMQVGFVTLPGKLHLLTLKGA